MKLEFLENLKWFIKVHFKLFVINAKKTRRMNTKAIPWNPACFDNCTAFHTDVKLLIFPDTFHLLLSPKKTHVQFPNSSASPRVLLFVLLVKSDTQDTWEKVQMSRQTRNQRMGVIVAGWLSSIFFIIIIVRRIQGR